MKVNLEDAPQKHAAMEIRLDHFSGVLHLRMFSTETGSSGRINYILFKKNPAENQFLVVVVLPRCVNNILMICF